MAQVDDSQLDRDAGNHPRHDPAERADPKIINGSRRLRIANAQVSRSLEVNQLVDRFFEARKQMAAMTGRMAGPGGGRKKRPRGKGQEGKEGPRGTDAAQGARRVPRMPPGGFPGMPAGMPDLSSMPPGLDELPEGLANIDFSQFDQNGKKK